LFVPPRARFFRLAVGVKRGVESGPASGKAEKTVKHFELSNAKNGPAPSALTPEREEAKSMAKKKASTAKKAKKK
jgi:hypothetical protein